MMSHDVLVFIRAMLLALDERDRMKLDDIWDETLNNDAAMEHLTPEYRATLRWVWRACKSELDNIHSETVKPDWIA